MINDAFPRWADHGIAPSGGFWEALSLEGKTLQNPIARVRVQGRQIYCFCVAHEIGWDPARSKKIVEDGVHFLISACRRDDGLYGRNVDLSGVLSDDTAELYDSAFALLAFATAFKTLDLDFAREAGTALNEAIENLLYTDEGYLERLPHHGMRAQNPHMHLFEASLAWYESTKDDIARRRIERILDLFVRRLFDSELPGLREAFTLDWVPHADDRLEAGHQFEWTWLLSEARRLGIAVPERLAHEVYTVAKRLTDSDSRIPLSHHFDATPRENVHRTWVQTEALKAHLVMEPGPKKPAAELAFDRLWKDHLLAPVTGGWADKRDSDGALLSQDIPASTGYHVICALSELLRINRNA